MGRLCIGRGDAYEKETPAPSSYLNLAVKKTKLFFKNIKVQKKLILLMKSHPLS
jgi:hypothetical protein